MNEVAVMYTGTLINDLMKTAERLGKQAERQIKEDLHEIFTMQIPSNEGDQVYRGVS